MGRIPTSFTANAIPPDLLSPVHRHAPKGRCVAGESLLPSGRNTPSRAPYRTGVAPVKQDLIGKTGKIPHVLRPTMRIIGPCSRHATCPTRLPPPSQDPTYMHVRIQVTPVLMCGHGRKELIQFWRNNFLLSPSDGRQLSAPESKRVRDRSANCGRPCRSVEPRSKLR